MLQIVIAGNWRLYVGKFVLSITVVVGVFADQLQDIHSKIIAVIKAEMLSTIQMNRSYGLYSDLTVWTYPCRLVTSQNWTTLSLSQSLKTSFNGFLGCRKMFIALSRRISLRMFLVTCLNIFPLSYVKTFPLFSLGDVDTSKDKLFLTLKLSWPSRQENVNITRLPRIKIIVIQFGC